MNTGRSLVIITGQSLVVITGRSLVIFTQPIGCPGLLSGAGAELGNNYGAEPGHICGAEPGHNYRAEPGRIYSASRMPRFIIQESRRHWPPGLRSPVTQGLEHTPNKLVGKAWMAAATLF